MNVDTSRFILTITDIYKNIHYLYKQNDNQGAANKL